MDIQEQLLDHVIVLKAQTGDGQAYTRLIERYHKRLLYYLRRLADDEAAAEDMAQNVWFTVFQSLSTLRDPQAFAAWLFRIAHRQAALSVRHLRKERKALETLPVENNRENTLEFPHDAEIIHTALQQLTIEHREVLVLKYFEELTYEDIAYVTELNIGTVRSRIHYAKQALKKEMEALRHEPG